MSYDVALYRKEAKEAEQKSNDGNFFDFEGKNVVPFTTEQRNGLKTRLFNYDYEIQEESSGRISFYNEAEGVSALLTDRALYFSVPYGADGIFEMGMTVSEFTDTGEFAKYDPQQNGWEET
ncbi:MAG: hypothetical protein LBS91_01765 [Clostridiales Family XIII bacterium]|jgi:hypothetical protein|nr:hypothetical protein [Clostridiales Family XIII bacterium]